MPAKQPRRTRRSDKQWQAILARLEASGLSAREFCRRERIPISSLQRRRGQVKPGVAASFVELSPVASDASWEFEVALPNGVSLRFRG